MSFGLVSESAEPSLEADSPYQADTVIAWLFALNCGQVKPDFNENKLISV